MGQNRLTIQNRINLLISDMGKMTFLKVLHFVIEVMEDDHEIKVLMARRFLDLFLEFEEIVQYLYEGSVKKRGKFLTNLSIALLQNELADKTVLIVDDIRLHGRALEEVCSFLVEKCHCEEKNIVLKVFADNKDAVKVESKFHIEIEIKEVVNENRWRKISSSFINSLYISGQPYVSHLPYCEIPFGTEGAEAINRMIKSNDANEITTEIERYYGVQAFLYFMDCGMDKEFADRMPFVEQNIIRIYIYEKLEKMVIVPYAFLKPIGFDGLRSFYRLLCSLQVIKEIGSPYKRIIDTHEIEENGPLARYLYSMAVYVSSLLLGVKFFNSRLIKDFSWNSVIEEYSFGFCFQIGDIEDIIRQLANVERGKYADYKVENIQLEPIPDMEELLNQIKRINREGLSPGRFIESYIKLSGRRDESLAEQNKKRMRGIEYVRLYKYFLKENRREIWKAIIGIIDSGRGTLSAALNILNQKPFMDSLLFGGEQNFTCNESNLIYFVYPLLEYENFWKGNLAAGTLSSDDMMKGKSNLIKLIMDLFPELRSMADEEEIRNLKEKSILESGMDYYMSRYPAYEEDKRLKEILGQTRSYGKG